MQSDPFVICTVCGKRKHPLGRDPGVVAGDSYCGHDCSGYRLDPFPSPWWPGERDRNEQDHMADRVNQLEDAIRTHRNQKADDRCIEDDDRLYEALGDGIKCDRRVGDKKAMLANCKRFIERRCEGGHWPSYAELERKFTETLRSLLDEYKTADCERLKETEEAHQEAAKWKGEDDMYGWNFHEGRASGTTAASIIFYRLRKRLEVVISATSSPVPEHSPDHMANVP